MRNQVATRLAGGGAQLRADTSRWTQAKCAQFLNELAQTANVTASAASVGMSFQSAYKLRRRDKGFADAWEQAICDAYDTVEMLLLERTIIGLGGEADASGNASKLEKLSERGMLALLSQHRQTARNRRGKTEAESGIGILRAEQSARERLEKKLLEMEARLKADDDAAQGD